MPRGSMAQGQRGLFGLTGLAATRQAPSIASRGEKGPRRAKGLIFASLVTPVRRSAITYRLGRRTGGASAPAYQHAGAR